MLKVLPIQNKEEQEKICHLCSVEFKPDLLAYVAENDGIITGISQFKLTHEGGIIYDIAAANGNYNFESLFVMGRGTLNFIDLCGIHKAFFDGEADDTLLRAIGFRKNESGRYEVDLEGFFDEPCKHNK